MVELLYFWRYCTRLLDTHAILMSVMMRFFLYLTTLNYIMWPLYSYLGQLTAWISTTFHFRLKPRTVVE